MRVHDVVPELPRVGDVVDRYRVIAPVATGGMAAVYAAQRTSLGGFDKLLALKVILPHLASERYFLDMFLDEARIASQIQHPNVVGVHDVVEHRTLPCIVMEYLHGRSFADVLAAGPPVALRIAVLAAAADGLAAAHRARGRDGLPLGVVHRDVSPQNVHVAYDGQVRLVDFGIAAARGRLSSTRAGTVKGKLEYLAPEQITGSDSIGPATDVWSFGVMAWQALSERALFADEHDAATMWNVVHRDVDPLPAAIDRELAAVIMGCLARAPTRRSSLDECVRVLGELARRELGDPRAALAAHMATSFAEEKRTDDHAIERTLSHAKTLGDAALPTPPPRRRALWGWIGAAAIGATAIVALASTREDTPDVQQTRTAPPVPTDEVPAAVPAPAGPPEPTAVAASPPPPTVPSSVEPTAPPADSTRRTRRERARERETAKPAPAEDRKHLFDSPYGP